LDPIIPNATTKVLDALNVKPKVRNLSFLDGNNIFNNEIKINDLDILFKKIT
jgi:methionyl-tRNA synthetase